MHQLIAIFKALSDRNRLRCVLALLRHEELCACQLTELIGVTGATASRHMGILIASGLVDSRKDGRWVHYRICRERPDLAELAAWIETQLRDDSDAGIDVQRLADITSCGPEDLCRQRREISSEK